MVGINELVVVEVSVECKTDCVATGINGSQDRWGGGWRRGCEGVGWGGEAWGESTSAEGRGGAVIASKELGGTRWLVESGVGKRSRERRSGGRPEGVEKR